MSAPSEGRSMSEPVAKVDGAWDQKDGEWDDGVRLQVTPLLEPAEAWREIVESGGLLYASPPGTEGLVEALRQIGAEESYRYNAGTGAWDTCVQCGKTKDEGHHDTCPFEIVRRALAAYEGGE